MRERQNLIGWGFGMTIYEDVEDPYSRGVRRCICQSVRIWRNATKLAGGPVNDFRNPRSVVQERVNIAAIGPNEDHLRTLSLRSSITEWTIAPAPYSQESQEALRSTPMCFSPRHRPGMFYHRGDCAPREEFLRVMTRMMCEPAPPGFREAMRDAD